MVNSARILSVFVVVAFAITGAAVAQNPPAAPGMSPPPAVKCQKQNGCPKKQQKKAQKQAKKQAKQAQKQGVPANTGLPPGPSAAT